MLKPKCVSSHPLTRLARDYGLATASQTTKSVTLVLQNRIRCHQTPTMTVSATPYSTKSFHTRWSRLIQSSMTTSTKSDYDLS